MSSQSIINLTDKLVSDKVDKALMAGGKNYIKWFRFKVGNPICLDKYMELLAFRKALDICDEELCPDDKQRIRERLNKLTALEHC